MQGSVWAAAPVPVSAKPPVTEALNRFENGTVITAELLKAEGIISKIEKDGLKVLGRGELTQRLTVKAAKVSNSAREAIVAVGGTVEVPNV